MRSLAALAFRNLWVRKARTLFMIGGIMLGVALILAMSVTTHSAEASVQKLFEEAAGRANLVVTSDSPAEGGFSEKALRRVQDTLAHSGCSLSCLASGEAGRRRGNQTRIALKN